MGRRPADALNAVAASGDWITPHFGAGSATIVWLALAAVLLTAFATWAFAYDPTRVAPDQRDAAVRRARFRRIALAEAAIVAAVAMLVLSSPGVSWNDLGVRAVAGTGVWLTTGYLIVLAVVGGFLRRRRMQARRAPVGRVLRDRRPIIARAGERPTLIMLAILIGAAEELLYRGLFVSGAVGLLGLSAPAAVAVVAVVFGVAHSAQGARAVVVTGVVGGLLGAMYLSGQSLLPPILVHAALDAVAFAVVPAAPLVAPSIGPSVGGTGRRED